MAKTPTYVLAKDLLLQFPQNLKYLHDIQQELYYVKRDYDMYSQRYGEQPSAGSGPVDRVFLRVSRIFTLENVLETLEFRVVPLLRLRNALKNSLFESDRVRFYIMEQHFFERIPLNEVMLHLGKNSIVYMRTQRRRLLNLVRNETMKFSRNVIVI